GPPRGPGCRRSSASEQGLALPEALDFGPPGARSWRRAGGGGTGWRRRKGVWSSYALAKAVSKLGCARLAVLCRADDLPGPEWKEFDIRRVPMIPYTQLSRLLAAADVIAIPQLDTEAGRYQMPMKVYDCMTMAKPIVASAVTDLPLVLEGCGRVVPPSDVHLVRGALRDM